MTRSYRKHIIDLYPELTGIKAGIRRDSLCSDGIFLPEMDLNAGTRIFTGGRSGSFPDEGSSCSLS